MTPEHAAEPPQPPSPQLASLKARFAAKLIDLIITAAIAFVALMFFAVVTLSLFELNTDAEAYRGAALFVGVPVYEAATIATTTWKGKTLGKKLLKIQVVVHGGSQPPSALRATLRWVLPLAPTAPLIDAFVRDIPELANDHPATVLSGRVWWLWVAVGWWLLVHASTLWDSQRRGWHDRAAGTIVIQTPRADRRSEARVQIEGGTVVVKAPRPSRSAPGGDLRAEWQRRHDLPLSAGRFPTALDCPLEWWPAPRPLR